MGFGCCVSKGYITSVWGVWFVGFLNTNYNLYVYRRYIKSVWGYMWSLVAVFVRGTVKVYVGFICGVLVAMFVRGTLQVYGGFI